MEESKIDFTNMENIPLKPEETVKSFGKTLIVAPHPDDESLGCGGLIALLRKYERAVFILVLSDGTQSHPNSKKFPSEKLRDLRENELFNAAAILDVKKENITFFRFRDRQVPDKSSKNFAPAVSRLQQFLATIKPQTIFVPWRRDPHPDHRAAFQLITAAKDENYGIYEYPIWLYDAAARVAAPLTSEVSAFRLDINLVLKKKQKAIFAHRSQTTRLIDDDPKGFSLSPEVLQYFAVPFEIFLK